MKKEEIEKAKIGLWNIRADCLKIIQCGLSDRQDREGCLKEIDTIDDIFKYIKQLEQKSETLDKVTDKLKEDIVEAKEKIKYWEEQYRISKAKKDEFYKNSYKRQINRWQSRFETLREILNIIEGEK